MYLKLIQNKFNGNLCVLSNDILKKTDQEILFQYAVRTGYLVSELKISSVYFWDVSAPIEEG